MNTHDHNTHGHPLSEEELITLSTCAGCQRKLTKTGTIFFWKVTMERHALDLRALRAHTGLAMALNSGRLASAMGPESTFTEIVQEAQTVTLCDECATHPHILMLLHAQAVDAAERRKLHIHRKEDAS